MSERVTSLPEHERELIFWLVTELTGACQSGSHRREFLVANVFRRMQQRGCATLTQYLELSESEGREYEHLLSAVTIHTTHWLVVQHMQAGFLQGFAQRLATAANVRLSNDPPGTVLRRGTLYMALDDRHLAVRGTPGQWILERPDSPAVNRHRPSMDVLFHSAARYNATYCALLLTGMGSDGAEGLTALRRQGHPTAAQDEASSTVFGMPREAIARGAAQRIGNLHELRAWRDRLLALQSASGLLA